jgi:hypothetical protein
MREGRQTSAGSCNKAKADESAAEGENVAPGIKRPPAELDQTLEGFPLLGV